MINAGSLRITWPGQWLGDAFEAHKASFPDEWRLYIESLDGATGRAEVLAAMKHLGMVPQSAGNTVMPQRIVEGLNFNDERIFSGYDAIWIAAGLRGKDIAGPSFITYMAAEKEGALPCSLMDASQQVPWDKVEAWMSANEIVAGFATAAGVVVIERLADDNR